MVSRHPAPRGEWTLFSEENVSGLVDLHAQVGSAAELRIGYLSEAAVGIADLLCARARRETEHGECLLARHPQAAVAVSFHAPREASVGAPVLKLRSRLPDISPQHRNRLSHQLRINRRARCGEPAARTGKILRARRKSLPAALSGPNSTRQRGAACTNTGSMKAASIIADVQRPVATSHTRTPTASAASATSAHRPELMIARGSALRIQPPILTADTNKESASVA